MLLAFQCSESAPGMPTAWGSSPGSLETPAPHSLLSAAKVKKSDKKRFELTLDLVACHGLSE